jgi:hypothetical protein
MRMIEKIASVLIVALWAWALIMWTATSFRGQETDRIMRVELSLDAASLNQAVSGPDRSDVAHNMEMVVRNTKLDFGFILLYWLSFLSLAALAGRMGQRSLAICSALFITGAAVCDLFENGAILTAMRVKLFTDPVAVDISEFSQWKWSGFFLASLLLGLALAINHRISTLRRVSGGLFIAGGVIGLFGMTRYRVSLGFAMGTINLALLLLSAALLLSLWKIFLSLRGLSHVEHVHHPHSHA